MVILFGLDFYKINENDINLKLRNEVCDVVYLIY